MAIPFGGVVIFYYPSLVKKGHFNVVIFDWKTIDKIESLIYNDYNIIGDIKI